MLQKFVSFTKAYAAAFVTAICLSMAWVGVIGDIFGFVATPGEHVVAAAIIAIVTFIVDDRFSSSVKYEEMGQANEVFGWLVVPSLILTALMLTRFGAWLAELGGPPQPLLAFVVWMPTFVVILIGTPVAWAQEAKA